ncbi:MAG: ATP synthase F1 subunit gamma [Ignavibacteriae bacterium]|nr:ATP synthase F1 subunit gamma [Ignavibacteriota bacterium]
MATLRDIRHRISAVKNTAKITSAMKMVAAAKLRRAQEAIMAARPYTLKLSEILSNLAEASDEDFFHPLLRKPKTVKSIAVVVVSSDRGLCGSFNANLLKAAAYHIEKSLPSQIPGVKVSVLPIGKRAVSFFSKRSTPVIQEFPDIFAKLDFSTAFEVASIISDGFINEKYDKVEIFGNEFKSIIKQEVKYHSLLPLEKSKTEHKVHHEGEMNNDYIFEPSRGEIMNELLPKFLNIQIWTALLDSNAAEQAARMMAMDNATTNARDLIKALQLQYNKARQASITKEMLEIVGGAEALRK